MIAVNPGDGWIVEAVTLWTGTMGVAAVFMVVVAPLPRTISFIRVTVYGFEVLT